MKNVIKLCVLLPIAAVMLMACASDDDSGPTDSGGHLTLTLTLVDANTMTLTSNFNCIDCPVFENGHPYLKITTTSNTPYSFPVSRPYCYQSGGLFFLFGYIWSDTVCVP